MGGLTRHRRAVLFHSRSPGFWQTTIASLLPSVAIGLYLWYRGREPDPIEDIAIPVLIGLLFTLVTFLWLWGYEYVRLFLSGTAPTGSKRTLKHLNTRRVRQGLTDNVPGMCSITLGGVNTKEIQDFADEIQKLLEECGWRMGGQGFMLGAGNRDIEFHPPIGGNQGLVELSELLNRTGYKSTIVNYGGSSASIDIGEATH